MTIKRLYVQALIGVLGVVGVLIVAAPAAAYALRKDDGQACAADGAACNVICDNGQRAGVMFWNGSVWTDGVRSDRDRDVVARKICEANGTACT